LLQVGDDWVQIVWPKIRFLRQMGLKPWYIAPIDNRL